MRVGRSARDRVIGDRMIGDRLPITKSPIADSSLQKSTLKLNFTSRALRISVGVSHDPYD